jgi:large subunit ribosomal protein L5
MVTLRGEKMYEFSIADQHRASARAATSAACRPSRSTGAATTPSGIRDHLIFPEIDAGKVDKAKGMNITIVTSAKNDEQARFLLRELGMPFGK